MKIAIGSKIQSGAFGGGNQFAVSLSRFLLKKGINVVYDLKDDDIDLILLTEPRKHLRISAFDHVDIFKYLLRKKDTIVIHRINECDARKRTKLVNGLLARANRCADYTVFISDWLRGLFEAKGCKFKNFLVIYNGADTTIFNSDNYVKWDDKSKVKIVTHHWGANWLKGFDIYKRLDQLLGLDGYKDKIEFTYIGSLPKGFSFKNSNYVNPLFGSALACCLSEHHIYLTASQNEPAGMHHIEGILCGLPLLYRNSGALPEYCGGYGVMFDETNFEEKLKEIIENYDHWVDRVVDYRNSAEKMCEQYYKLFLKMVKSREELLLSRDVFSFSIRKRIFVSRYYKIFYRVMEYIGRIKRVLSKR